MRDYLKNNKGSSMLLTLCLFFILTVLGINLLNAVNSNVNISKEEFKKEQEMLYVSSIYKIVNQMIEQGAFCDDNGKLPLSVTTKEGAGFLKNDGNDVKVQIKFNAQSTIKAEITIQYKEKTGEDKNYTIISTYGRVNGSNSLKRLSCKGLVGNDG